jgi:hypothetical protein
MSIEQAESIVSASALMGSDFPFKSTLSTFLGTTEADISIESFGKYSEYHDLTWAALKMATLPKQTAWIQWALNMSR